MVRVTGNLSIDGTSITLVQGGNSTTLTSGSPAGDITITLPSTSAPILVNPMDSAGDMMYGGASGLVTKLDSGTADYMLKANGAAAPTWALISNANVDAAAAITLSKLAALTASRALVSDGSGVVSVASTTATQIGYLSASTGTTGTTSTNIVFSTSPTLITPVLGVATATSINKVAITAPATGSTLTIADGKTLTVSNTLSLTGTDSSSVAFGTGGTVIYATNKLSDLAATTSLELKNTISDETGSGALVFATSPTLVTPVLGVAAATSINKMAITAPATSSTLAVADGKTLTASNTLTLTGTDGSSAAFGAGGTVAYTANKLSDFAATTSLELKNTISDETGSGALVFANTPTLVTPVLGAATATSINGNTISTGTGTLTLGSGSTLVTSATNSITLTSTGATNVTLPTTGTLATLAGTEALTNKDIDGGTASDSSRITIPKAATATLTALTRKQGTIVYDSTLDVIKYDNGSILTTLSSTSAATSTAAGIVTSYAPTITSGVGGKSASYTGTENDGYHTIIFTTSSSALVYTTPAVAVSAGRRLRIIKGDTGTGTVTLTLADGSQVGRVSVQCSTKGDYFDIQCDGTNWYVTDNLEIYVSTSALTFSNVTGQPATQNLKIYRKGDSITWNLLFTSVTFNTSTPAIATGWPSRFRPSTDVWVASGYLAGSATGYPTNLVVGSGGSLSMYRDNTNNFTNTQTASSPAAGASYISFTYSLF